MGEVAERVGQYVSAYSSDLRDESLDGQRVVIGGIVTGVRTVVTKARASMAIVTMEDLQGTVEVVVFPRLYEQTGPIWREGDILLVAGRVDHKGEEISLLADLVVEWEAASAAGPDAFARQVAAGDRNGPRRYPVQEGAAAGPTNGGGPGPSVEPARSLVPVGPGRPVAVGAPVTARVVQYVSPRRASSGGAPIDLPPIAPAEPISAHVDPPGGVAGADERDDQPAVPDEARSRIVAGATADAPQDAGPGTVLHVRFADSAPADRVVGAMEALKAVMRDRPGETRVIIHLPTPSGGGALPMELRRGVAYDVELLSEVRRRFGEGLMELRLS
jgi:hypothetical protein